jgi:hypothetical protein
MLFRPAAEYVRDQMLAFILAGVIVAVTLVLTFVDSLPDNLDTGRGSFAWPTLVIGLFIAAVIASSHWWNLSW